MELTKRISKKVIGTSPAGEEQLLIQIDFVEEHQAQNSDYNYYVRVNVYNQDKIDTFIFNTDDMKVKFNFLQTGDEELRLLEKYLMLLQDHSTLSNFIEQIVLQYFGGDLNYKNFHITKGAD